MAEACAYLAISLAWSWIIDLLTIGRFGFAFFILGGGFAFFGHGIQFWLKEDSRH